MREEPKLLLHLLDNWYEPKTIEELKKPETIEELKKKLWFKEGWKKNEITFHLTQWKRRTHVGILYRKESVTVTRSDSVYIPKEAVVVYRYLPDEENKEYMEKLLNNFSEEAGHDVVELIRDYDNNVIGFKATGGFENVVCSLRELEEKKIYGPNFEIEVYGIPKIKEKFIKHLLGLLTSHNNNISA